MTSRPDVSVGAPAGLPLSKRPLAFLVPCIWVRISITCITFFPHETLCPVDDNTLSISSLSSVPVSPKELR